MNQYGFRKGISTIGVMDSLVREVLEKSLETKHFAQATSIQLKPCVLLCKSKILVSGNQSYRYLKILSYKPPSESTIFAKTLSEEAKVKWGCPVARY